MRILVICEKHLIKLLSALYITISLNILHTEHVYHNFMHNIDTNLFGIDPN